MTGGRFVGVVLLIGCVVGCVVGCTAPGGRSDPSAPESPYAGWVRRLDRAVEAGAAPAGLLDSAIAHPDPVVRREAARAMAVLAPENAVPSLVARLDAGEPLEVRAAAVISLGLLHRGTALAALADLLSTDPDPTLRRHAAVAIGRLEGKEIGPDAVRALLGALFDLDPGVRGGAALALWHHGEAARAAITTLTARLDDLDDEVRWRAAYALMKIEDPATHAPLRARLADPHPWVRTFAAWGMREPTDPTAVDALGALLADPTSPSTARVQALRSLGAIRAKHPEVNEAIRDLLLVQLYRERHPGATEVLLEALATGAGELELPILESILDESKGPTVLRAAIRAWGTAAKEAALERLRTFVEHEDPWTRVAVATALAEVGPAAGPTLTAMLREDDVRVRAAAADAVAKLDAPFRWPLLRTMVGDPDLAVRSTAVVAIIAGKPDGWIETVCEVWAASREPEYWELRVAVLEALAVSAPATATVLSEQGLEDPFLAVRRASSKILERDPPTALEAELPLGLPSPRLDDPFAPDEPIGATIETDRGTLQLELHVDEAPRHVAGFVAFAEQGLYDGLLFHRVVPSFVVQGADPRGDGWGDAGYHLVDEFNAVEFVRGTLGMPRAGHHTGGCQIFITHLPTPHLDGRYTVFGQVVEGFEVLDRIEVGDRIRRITIDREASPRRAAF